MSENYIDLYNMNQSACQSSRCIAHISFKCSLLNLVLLIQYLCSINIDIFSSFEAGNCISSSSFKSMKNRYKHFSDTGVKSNKKEAKNGYGCD